MRKAKIMLSAIAIIAIVSGVMAFKASKFNALPYFYCSENSCIQTTAIALTIVTPTPPAGYLTLTSSGTLATVAGVGCVAKRCTSPLYYIYGQ